jgi:hypothetical protein
MSMAGRYTIADGDRLAEIVRQAFAGQDGTAQGRAVAEALCFYQAIIARLDDRVNALENRLAEISAPEKRLAPGEGPALRS